MVQKYFPKIHHKWIIITFLFISILPFSWLVHSYPVCSWDTGYGFYCPKIGNDLNLVKFVWDYSVSSGRPMEYYHATFFTTALLYTILDKIPLSQGLIQGILFFCIIFLSLLSMYALVLDIFNYKEDRYYIAFFSSIFYVLNFGTIFWFIYNLVNFIYIIPLTPLILYVLLKTFRKHTFFYLFLMSSLFGLFSVVFMNAAFGIIIIIMCFLFYLVFNGLNRIKVAFLIIFLSFLLNSFWILPAISSYQYFFADASGLSSIKETFDVGSINNLFSTMTLIPSKNFWPVNISAESWIYIYYSWPFKIISILLIIIIFSSLFCTKNDVKIILFFSFIATIGIYLAKGKNEPLGFIMEYFMNDNIIPFLPRIFAMSNQKFSIVIILSYSVLFGYGSYFLLSLTKGYNRIILSFLIISSIFILAFPFFNGQLINSPIIFGGANVTPYVEIPREYNELNNYLMKNNEDYRILSLPLLPYNMGTYNWTYGYLGEPFEKNLFHKSTFSVEVYKKTWDNGIGIIDQLINSEENLDKVLGLFNIKYVILHHDFDINNGNYNGKKLDDPMHIEKILVENNFIHVKSFGMLDLYETPIFLSHIYSANKYKSVNNTEEMIHFMKEKSFIPGDSIIFVKNISTKGKTNFNIIESDYHPNITYKRINPTKYQVFINASQPFFLVFSESFSSQWKIYIDKPFDCKKIIYYYNLNVNECKQENTFIIKDMTYLYKKPILEENHIIADGYANAWYIDPKKIGTTNFTITIYFLSQSYFYAGLMISIITFVICAIYLIWKGYTDFKEK